MHFNETFLRLKHRLMKCIYYAYIEYGFPVQATLTVSFINFKIKKIKKIMSFVLFTQLTF